MKMKPYIRPRVGGVKKLSMFIEGFEKYLRDCGDTRLKMSGFDGSHTFAEAADFIKGQIDAGFPVPYLMLRHKDPIYKDLYGTGSVFWIRRERRGSAYHGGHIRGGQHIFAEGSVGYGYEEKGGLIRYME